MRVRIVGALAALTLWAMCGAASAGAAGWALVPTAPAGDQGSQLHGVSCTAPTACVAVGSTFTAAGQELPLAEHWDGHHLTLQSSPSLPGASGRLTSVSCVSSNQCFAVGQLTSASTGQTQPLAAAWSGGAWTALSVPDPAGTQLASLASVSCASATSCAAVGSFLSTELGGEVPLAERWNGTSWSIQDVPTPAGVTNPALQSVSCPATNRCEAVGSYQTGGLPFFAPLAEAWNGTSWTIQATPTPANARAATLNSVSCSPSSPAACLAVGTVHPQDGGDKALVLRWNGSTWTRQPGFSVKAATDLYGVSCPTSACKAIGQVVLSPDQATPLAEELRLDGALPEAAAEPPRTHESGLNAVACPSMSFCLAVGSAGPLGQTRALAERFTAGIGAHASRRGSHASRRRG